MFLIYLFVISQWAKAYGGADEDICLDMKITPDGGYIMVGESRTYYSPGEILLIKVDSEGTLQWAKDYAMPTHKVHHEGWSVDTTPGGGYILAGRIDTTLGGQYRSLIIKTDGVGNIQWTKRFGTVSLAGPNFGYMQCIHPTSDGNYITAGWDDEFGLGSHESVIMKLNPSGNTIWVKDYTGTGDDEHSELRCIQQTTDGGYIACGHIDCAATGGLEYALVMKLDSIGNIDWWKAYGCGMQDYYANWIEQTTDSGYIVAGDSAWWYPGILVMKLDKVGNVQWSNTYTGDTAQVSKYVQQTTDGGYIVCGATAPAATLNADVFLMKLYPDGSVEWAKRFQGDQEDYGICVHQLPTGYIVGGYTTSYSSGSLDFMLIKFLPSGDIPGCPVYDCSPKVSPISLTVANPAIYSCIPTNTTNFTIIDTSVTPQVVDICGAKIEETLIQTKGRLVILPTVGNSFKIQYEVPTNYEKEIGLRIYDSSGRLVKTFPVSSIQHPVSSVIWTGRDNDGKSVPAGNYYCELKFNGNKIQKVIVVR